MYKIWKKASLAGMAAGVALFSGSVFAQCPDPENPECPPVDDRICHNIGGPMDLGANCDPATGTCEVLLDTGALLIVPENFFLGIVIPDLGGNALVAHIAHGDGPVVAEFVPPLHLASTGQIHQASNVECIAERIFPQPPEPGN